MRYFIYKIYSLRVLSSSLLKIYKITKPSKLDLTK